MIFYIFLFLFALALVLIISGFAVDIPLFAMIGAVLLMSLGGITLGNDVMLKTGVNTSEIQVYGNDFTGYHWDGYNGTSEAPSKADREAFLFHVEKEEIYTYEPYEWGEIGGTAYGWFFLILGVGMFIISLTMLGD